ncbi:MAG TPA: hypothetical protein VLX92_18865 [Kofleriaceae bacterium]|nr:hypothetical protein [Kofleriaceae bacterium]
MSRWSRYWFADGGRLAAGVMRIAIACAVALSLARLDRLDATEVTRGLYRPVGIWMVLGHVAPPALVVDALWWIAWASTVAMAIGLYSRAATAVSFVSAVALASLSFSSSHTWSHQYNVVFLAQLAFLGARGGDALSLDAVIRSMRGLPARDVPRGYQWSVRLVQLAVALMFACAAFHKILHGHFTLRWALSDNLRNQLLVRFDLAGLDRPALVDWIIDDPWRYRTAAMLNLVSQSAPILACFLMRRPVLRAACGLFFVVETVALALVVALWNPQWLPLYAAFVDWDALVGWIARRPRPAERTPDGWRPRRAARIFVIAFVAYDAVTAVVPALDQWLNTYPFSGFPMFATVRARAPYDEHVPYSVPGDHFEVYADHPVAPNVQRWFDHANRAIADVRDPVELRKRLAKVVRDGQARYPDAGIRGARLYLAIFEAPAYPAPAHFEPHPIAVVGELAADGTFRTALGALHGDRVVPAPQGVDLAGARFAYYRDDVPTPIAMTGDVVGPGDPIYAVAIAADGTPWLIASRAGWHWQ